MANANQKYGRKKAQKAQKAQNGTPSPQTAIKRLKCTQSDDRERMPHPNE
jgi:hypothetical protein